MCLTPNLKHLALNILIIYFIIDVFLLPHTNDVQLNTSSIGQGHASTMDVLLYTDV